MPIRTIATLAVAVFLGILAVVLVRSYLGIRGQSGGSQLVAVGTTPVVVASQAVARGVVLQPALLKIVNFPKDSVPEGAFQSISQLAGAQEGQHVALRSMVTNEPILPGEISEPGGKLILAIEISAGMRAVSLRSNDVAGVGGFVVPGDRVDVMLTRTIEIHTNNQPSNTITQVLAENVRVLGVDQSDDEEANKPVVAKAITIEVTPAQAQAISLGQSLGSLSLALRNIADNAPLTRQTTSVADLSITHPIRSAARTEFRVTRGVESSVYHVSGSTAP